MANLLVCLRCLGPHDATYIRLSEVPTHHHGIAAHRTTARRIRDTGLKSKQTSPRRLHAPHQPGPCRSFHAHGQIRCHRRSPWVTGVSSSVFATPPLWRVLNMRAAPRAPIESPVAVASHYTSAEVRCGRALSWQPLASWPSVVTLRTGLRPSTSD